MIAGTMFLDAYFKSSSVVGRSTLLGFLVAVYFTTLRWGVGGAWRKIGFESGFGCLPLLSGTGANEPEPDNRDYAWHNLI